jgi:imidazolonepropionase-like amidohydrolase
MRTVFSGGRVFDGTGSPLADGDVLIENGRFVEIGSGLDADESIDCAGKSVLPGLFDCHVHVTITHLDMLKLVHTPFSYRFFEAARNLKLTLDAGITTVRDAGGADLGIKQAVDDGLIDGPRMHISIGMITQTGGHGDCWTVSGDVMHLLPHPHPGAPDTVVDGPEEMRKKVRELVRHGADVIKVASSGGVFSSRDDPKHAHFRADELEMLVVEASAAGIPAMAHAQSNEGIKSAIRAGITSIEHGVYLDDEAIEMMLDAGTYLVPTLIAPAGVLAAAEGGAGIPERVLAKAREVVEVHRESFRMAVAAGVKIAMGTDSAVTPHGQNLSELVLMEEGGMAPTDVLVSATRTAAELMALDHDLGTIEPGKVADLLVIDGDPFDFKTLPARIDAVYKAGISI